MRKKGTYAFNTKTPRPSRFRSSYDEPETPLSVQTPASMPQKTLRFSRAGIFEGNPLLTNSELVGSNGYELLSVKEREVCLQLGILPKQYMLMKDVLLRENFRLGFLTKTSACKLLESFGMFFCHVIIFFHTDKSKASKLYDFLAYNGWIQPSQQYTL